jgi:DNA ligase 1
MREFAALYDMLDSTTSTLARLAAMKDYFSRVPSHDAAWALWILTGMKHKRAVSSTQLRRWAAEVSEMPDWLFEESYAVVGDLAETIALLLAGPATDAAEDAPLHTWMEQRIPALAALDEIATREQIRRWWSGLQGRELFLLNKLLTGGLRVGVARTLVERAVAEFADLSVPIVAHRLMGNWRPSAAFWEQLVAPESGAQEPSQPYPFFLAYPLEQPPESLGAPEDWQVEWKWDGIRGQLIRRNNETWLWSRGEELVTDRFPEIAAAALSLPNGTVLDGEILAWRDGAPLPFGDLQHRIGRTTVSKKTVQQYPVVFVTYDLLEWQGADIRPQPLAERRFTLEAAATQFSAALKISAVIEAHSWADRALVREQSRAMRTEGFMLKHRQSPYRNGRKKGDWYKWKVDPMTVDVVMLYAQAGHGKRANLYTDYTFGVWHEGALTPVAKAYSGLTDAEIAKVDAWIRRHTVEKFGPVRSVQPQLVFEIGFEGIQESSRHKSGIALRFPRILRWREDKPAAEADTLESLRKWLEPQA